MERRVRGNSHARCGAGEKLEITSNAYLSLLMDNFEWQKGFSMTFGLIAVDRATQTRAPKESLAFLGSCAK